MDLVAGMGEARVFFLGGGGVDGMACSRVEEGFWERLTSQVE